MKFIKLLSLSAALILAAPALLAQSFNEGGEYYIETAPEGSPGPSPTADETVNAQDELFKTGGGKPFATTAPTGSDKPRQSVQPAFEGFNSR